MNYVIYFLLGFSLVLNVITLKDGHNWGGDFGQYIINAQNILQGQEYSQGIMLEQTIVYPPGFPLLLAPLLKIFGLDFKILKSLNIVLWYLSIPLLFSLFRRKIPLVSALFCTLFLAYSSYFFEVGKQNILSDIPFTFFILAALWALESGYFLAALPLIIASTLIRSAGLALSVSLLFYFLIIKRDLKKCAAIIGCMVLALNLQSVFIHDMHPAFWRSFLIHPAEILIKIAQGASVVWESIIWVLCPGQTPLTLGIFRIIEAVAIILSPLLYIGIVVLFIQRCRKGTLSIIQCFCFFYLSLLLLWSSFGDSPQNFARYLLPILGLSIMLAMQWAQRYRKEIWMKVVLGVLILLNSFNIISIYHFNDDDLLSHRPNRELFQWVKQNIKPQEHYMIWEPRTIALMTKRVGTTLAWLQFNPQDRWHQILEQWQVQYVILNPLTDQDIIDYFSKQSWAQLVWDRVGYYVVFKISPV